MTLLAAVAAAIAAAGAADGTPDPSWVDEIAKIIDSLSGLVTAFGSLAGLAAAFGAYVALKRGQQPPNNQRGPNPSDPNGPHSGTP